ncbi:PREDICTED: SPARC-related modular calcium-binding protein 1 [Pygoscelis adeliae]|uniref:SPARC-related modular calcium-binding protein 1 n=1 Tax=Pygoscelis adeliae TaxID=9238 RepID=UPI0004F4D71F|nr:PREDICTED: SPARC-related modular calcium-binding protein 1 [Pygoscelis adeliae]
MPGAIVLPCQLHVGDGYSACHGEGAHLERDRGDCFKFELAGQVGIAYASSGVGSSGERKAAPESFLISDRDRDPQCNLHCSRSQSKPLCASDGRTYESMCDYQRAKCRESSLSVTHRGRCKDAGQSKCRLERAQALEQAKKPQEAVFIPECNEDGSFTQVQCHTYTGYCWCVTPDGKPISGSSVQNKTPVCSGSVTDKPSSQGNSGRKDDGSKPTPTMETQPIFDGEEITAPTLWIKHLVIKDSKLNSSSIRNSEKVHSCDQERQSALEEARQNPREGIVIPECAPGGLYKPVQCHQSTGYCWCVLVDTGRPLPGTSTRYETPVCESDARLKSTEIDDPFKDRELPGCPDGKKVEFITSLLDALTTDMVQAINSAAPTGGGRFSEPDPSHTLEERVVHWYFSQLDNNSSNDINKRELKPFKRYVKKKAKPKKCARRFTDYCDLNKDKSISLQELKGCLGVSKEGGSLSSFPNGKRQDLNPFMLHACALGSPAGGQRQQQLLLVAVGTAGGQKN